MKTSPLSVNLRDEMAPHAENAAAFLSGLANPHRLMILCELAAGERSVGQLIAATGIAPTSMSQHLNKLKDEAIVAARRDHRTLHYTIVHPAVAEMMTTLRRHFCRKEVE